MEYYFHI